MEDKEDRGASPPFFNLSEVTMRSECSVPKRLRPSFIPTLLSHTNIYQRLSLSNQWNGSLSYQPLSLHAKVSFSYQTSLPHTSVSLPLTIYLPLTQRLSLILASLPYTKRLSLVPATLPKSAHHNNVRLPLAQGYCSPDASTNFPPLRGNSVPLFTMKIEGGLIRGGVEFEIAWHEE